MTHERIKISPGFERCWVCAYRTFGTRPLERLANPYFGTLKRESIENETLGETLTH